MQTNSSESNIIPPLNFAMVSPGIYRSGFPNRRNFTFIRKLGLKSILYLTGDTIDIVSSQESEAVNRERSYRGIPGSSIVNLTARTGEVRCFDSTNTNTTNNKCNEVLSDNLQFAREHGITVFSCNIQSNREPFVNASTQSLCEVLDLMQDSTNQPILVHCSRGKHRTGCVLGCLRKAQQWSLVASIDEYSRFAGTAARLIDQQLIELFPWPPVSLSAGVKPAP